MKAKLFVVSFTCMAMSLVVKAGDVIRLNQVGYLPGQEKVIVIDNVAPGRITVKNAAGKTVLKAKAGRMAVSPFTGKKRYVVDLSALKNAGDYTIEANGSTAKLHIADKVYHDIATAAAKSYYLMRSGVPIEQKFAGKFARPLGHPDTNVLVHASAATSLRPEGTVLSSPLGWYDAGDFNKYIVNSAFTIGMMLAVYEQLPDYFENFQLNIPESGDATPDLLDELMFNIKWMFTMQDPADGGVYHKLTTPNFEGFVMPTDCHQTRYVVKKSVTAAYDFAAVMAKAARAYKQVPAYKDFPAAAVRAAKAAFEWAKAHPADFYRQGEMNKNFQPAVNTGEYGDGKADDELFWAATELYLTTGDASYLDDAKRTMPAKFSVPVWGNVGGLGIFAWLQASSGELSEKSKMLLGEFAAQTVKNTPTSNFQAPFGDKATDFGWGCLAEGFCAPAISLLFADKYVSPGKYRKEALRTVDYILGRNPLGYCYVTGFGQHSPMHPHQRISSADGIVEPMPGLLVGGPNPGQQDKGSMLNYLSNAPDESYLDHEASYASNEIAINWNACLVGLLCWIDALF